MSDIVKSAKITMAQGDGGTFDINVNELQDTEVHGIVEGLEASNYWAYYNYGLTYQDKTYPETFTLPAVPKDFASKEAKMVELQVFNDKKQSFFVKFKAHILKTGVTTELDAMVADLKTRTLGTFGAVDDVTVTVYK